MKASTPVHEKAKTISPGAQPRAARAFSPPLASLLDGSRGKGKGEGGGIQALVSSALSDKELQQSAEHIANRPYWEQLALMLRVLVTNLGLDKGGAIRTASVMMMEAQSKMLFKLRSTKREVDRSFSAVQAAVRHWKQREKAWLAEKARAQREKGIPGAAPLDKLLFPGQPPAGLGYAHLEDH